MALHVDLEAIRDNTCSLVKGTSRRRRTAADQVEGGVGGNAVEPRLKRCLATILPEPAERFDEGLLGGIFGVVRIARDAVGDLVDSIGMLRHEEVECLKIPSLAALD